jgi:hypothetical protein
MSEVVWSINIMIGILLIAVGYVIYWVFKYDDWNPNPITNSEHSRSVDTGHKELGSGAE